MALTGKTVAASYKSILVVNDYTNGIDSTVENITDGEGTPSSLNLSSRAIQIKPAVDTTSTFDVQDVDGNTILIVDSTNDLVKALGHNVNTMYSYFKFGSVNSATISAGTHYLVPFGANGDRQGSIVSIGTGTNPDTTLTISTTADDVVQTLWYIPDDITIDSVNWFFGADASSGDTVRGHLLSFTIDKANGSTGGDLSAGTVLADGSDIVGLGYEQAYFQGMTIQSANVDAGKVICFAFRGDTNNSDYSVSVIVKYHLR